MCSSSWKVLHELEAAWVDVLQTTQIQLSDKANNPTESCPVIQMLCLELRACRKVNKICQILYQSATLAMYDGNWSKKGILSTSRANLQNPSRHRIGGLEFRYLQLWALISISQHGEGREGGSSRCWECGANTYPTSIASIAHPPPQLGSASRYGKEKQLNKCWSTPHLIEKMAREAPKVRSH